MDEHLATNEKVVGSTPATGTHMPPVRNPLALRRPEWLGSNPGGGAEGGPCSERQGGWLNVGM